MVLYFEQNALVAKEFGFYTPENGLLVQKLLPIVKEVFAACSEIGPYCQGSFFYLFRNWFRTFVYCCLFLQVNSEFLFSSLLLFCGFSVL